MAEASTIKFPGAEKFFRKPSRARRLGAVTALDVDGRNLRIAQAAADGTILRIALEPLELPAGAAASFDPAALGKAIAETLRRARIKPGHVVLGVPRGAVLLRVLTLPAADDVRELASMVHFQVSKDLPFRFEEAVVDFTVRRSIAASVPVAGPSGAPPAAVEGEGLKLEVLAAIIKKDAVEFYHQVSVAAGVKLAALGWLSTAQARTIQAAKVSSLNEAVALVSLRGDEIGVDVVLDGKLLFSRGSDVQPPASGAPSAESAPASGDKAGSGDSYVSAVVIDVVRSLHNYAGTNQAPLSKVLLTGASGLEAVVLAALKRRLTVPCELLHLGALPLPAQARDNAAGAVAAVGLALGVNDPEGLPFDFLNPKQPAVQRDTKRLKILAAATALAALFLGLLITRAQLINKRMKINREVQLQLASAEKHRTIYRQMRQQAVTVQEWLRERRDYLEQYAWLSSILPGSEEVYVTSVSMTAPKTIRMAVQAQSSEILARVDKRLRAAGYDVRPLAVIPGSDKHGYNFRTTLEITIPDKLKIDLAAAQPPARPADDGSLDAKKGGGR